MQANDSSEATQVLYVVGDVGGTNSRLEAHLAHYSSDVDELVCARTYPSREYESLTAILRRFLDEEVARARGGAAEAPLACALAVAGPVAENRASITNLSWELDGEKMAAALGIQRVVLINDFAGVAFGLLSLQEDEVFVLNEGEMVEHAPIGVLGAGTGLGEGYLTWNGTEYDVWASEGGHSDFSPRNALELRLVRYMADRIAEGSWKMQSSLDEAVPEVQPEPERVQQRERIVSSDRSVDCALGVSMERDSPVRVSVERVVSGTGLPHIYNFLKQDMPDKVSPAVEAEMREKNPAQVITEHAKAKDDELCVKAAEIFVSAYGSEAGNLALKLLPYGGLYVAGGVAAKMIELLQADRKFWRAMTTKGRLSPALRTIPVYVVKGDVEVGLRGAQVLARRVIRRIVPESHPKIFSEPCNRCGESPKKKFELEEFCAVSFTDAE